MTTTEDGPGPARIAWFNCFSGIAGDMALGGLLDAGADLGWVEEVLDRLGVGGWSLSCARVLRGGIACARAEVRVAEEDRSRTAGEIASILERAELPDRVATRAHAVFRRLSEVEGRLHGLPPDQVHFHEVGGHDALVDVVGTAAALESLRVGAVYSSAVATGTGTVRSAHGVLPNPPPAVVRLLEGAAVRGLAVARELTTPTGAAILAALASGFGPMPAMEITSSGFGAGLADPDDLPNCTQVVIGVPTDARQECHGQQLIELSTNLDDATGEDLAESVVALLASGAVDAWITPVVMKKGRPGHVVHALADPADVPVLRGVMRTSTGTLGIRATTVTRWPDSRSMSSVTVAGQQIGMKIGRGRAKAEHDDLVAAAHATGMAIRELRSRAEEAWRRGASGPT